MLKISGRSTNEEYYKILYARYPNGRIAIFPTTRTYISEKTGTVYDFSRIQSALRRNVKVYFTLYSRNKEETLLYRVVGVGKKTADEIVNICHQIEGRNSLAPAGTAYAGSNRRWEPRAILTTVYGEKEANEIQNPGKEVLPCVFLQPVEDSRNIPLALPPNNINHCMHIWPEE